MRAKTIVTQVTKYGRLPQKVLYEIECYAARTIGKAISITIGEYTKKRSLPQNDLYRGYVLPHVREVMYDCGDARSLDAWHEVLIESFAPLVEFADINGNAKKRHKRTHEMDTKEMSGFTDAICGEMASRGYPLPPYQGNP